ncbi:MAG: hypothetical protein AAGA37_13715 [Actinomycetota bacterium]
MAEPLPPVSVPPEAHAAFRRGQLLILLGEFDHPVEVDRLGYMEFFAANPFLVWRDATAERTQLRLAGLLPSALSYQAAPERYANRRVRLRSDLAALVAWGFMRTDTVDGRIACELTDEGRTAATRLDTVYSSAYRLSVSLVAPKLRNVTNVELHRMATRWLRLGAMRVDLLDTTVGMEPNGQGVLL